MLRAVEVLDDDVDGLDAPSRDQGDATGVGVLAAHDLVEEGAAGGIVLARAELSEGQAEIHL